MDNKCLIFGAGAIGKSVAGYVFNKLGFESVFVDINNNVIDDINIRKSYRIYSSFQDPEPETISRVSAVSINDSEKIISLVCNADYLCTAVGIKGLDLVIPVLSEGIRARKNAKNPGPLNVLLCENHSEADVFVKEKLGSYLPVQDMESINLLETSIERMTKPMINDEGKFDVLAEEFFPVIISRDKVDRTDKFLNDTHCFLPVKDVKTYYYRKLYTNNLGHAVLGYFGYERGYKSVLGCIADSGINTIMWGALNEAGDMLVKKYGFNRDDIKAHLKKLLLRYSNEGLDDAVERLIREPKRKLSRNERLVGAAAACLDYGIYPRNIIKTILQAIYYRNTGDIQSIELGKMLEEKGMGYVLEGICGLKPGEPLYKEILDKLTNN